jgi:2-polyprenyl-3-methyl-5-hydroxy-6-metoxy-1,4-benzoquinol methylase
MRNWGGTDMSKIICRFCGSEINQEFVNLGMSPFSNGYVKLENLQNEEKFFPLHTYVCSECFLVQLQEFESPKQIFTEYAYFSSVSNSWLNHSKNYVEMMIKRFVINSSMQVVELASNDGYLLQYFKKESIPVLGIEPAKNVALEAQRKGIPTLTDFFSEELAERLVKENIHADLLIGNNVLAHVPNINNFVIGMKKLLSTNGIITMEFPHILKLIEENQFDTIYHEHFSYLSLLTVIKIFKAHDLNIFDVEELPTHGGSLRLFAKHTQDNTKEISDNVKNVIDKEIKFGLNKINTYSSFSFKVKKTKRNILNYLIGLKNEGKQIVGYGAPAKGNTLLNYCGIGIDFVDYTVDRNSYKQGLYLPGTHIPIFSTDKILETKPDYVIILPWNLKYEIIDQMDIIKEWGGKFITLIPDIEVY